MKTSGATGHVGQVVHVLFASVTGNAEEIARGIHSELEQQKLPQGVICDLQDYAKSGLESVKCAKDAFVFVASTTGEGDAPESAEPFMQFLDKKDPLLLRHVRYTVLGLGDSNYDNFCNTGKRIDAGMKKLGATSFYELGEADDGVGLEEVMDPWTVGLWNSIRTMFSTAPQTPTSECDDVPGSKLLNGNCSVNSRACEAAADVTDLELGFEESMLPRLLAARTTTSIVTDSDPEPRVSTSSFYNRAVVRVATVSGAQKLSSDDAIKEVWHIEVTCDDATGKHKSYLPGDAFGVFVENDTDEVRRMLKFIHEDEAGLARVCLPDGTLVTEGTVRRHLAERVDLRAVPKKTLLRALSRHCADRAHRVRLLQLCSKAGRQEYTERISRASLSVLKTLETIAPSCRPPLSLLLDQLPPLAPRWYSAASAASRDGGNVLHFAFSVVPNGLATRKLAALCVQQIAGRVTERILLLPRAADATSHFRPPHDGDAPYVMVGPGTGVAPFRGFLRERVSRRSSGRAMLFFGCRHPERDFLYREELEGMRDDDVVELDVAFSRLGDAKVYVQDRLRARADEVAQVLRDGGFFFVCGDGGGMAKGVDAALCEIVTDKLCDGDAKEGNMLVKAMAKEHRYVRDIWYFG